MSETHKFSHLLLVLFQNFSLTSLSSVPLLLLLLLTLSSNVGAIESGSDKTTPSLVSRFWEIGCEFSGVVTRVRRSAPNPPHEEPNFEDPEALFKYLYPLADVKLGDDNDDPAGSQRSNPGTHYSLSSWLEDLMELWHSECQHRRTKRSAERREEYNKKASASVKDSWRSQSHRIRGRVDRKRLVSALAAGKNSSLGISSLSSSRRGDNQDGSEINGDGDHHRYSQQDDDQEEDGQGEDDENEKEDENENEDISGYGYGYGGDGDPTSNNDNDQDGNNYYWRDFGKFKPTTPAPSKSTTATPTTAAPVPTPAPPPEDIFFAQYRGDIEYFFPLLSFGIPFDGEITLLGFHGFKGLFPGPSTQFRQQQWTKV